MEGSKGYLRKKERKKERKAIHLIELNHKWTVVATPGP
jgi:hypothetical protein